MITTNQTCAQCGAIRELRVGYKGQPRDIESAATSGGWRMLNSGSLEAWFCNQCVRALVKNARAAADSRGGQS